MPKETLWMGLREEGREDYSGCPGEGQSNHGNH
jgi:hypothetical protein